MEDHLLDRRRVHLLVAGEHRAFDTASLLPKSDVDAVAAIRREAADLLKVTRSAPRGLWLMAEAAAGNRDSLVLGADQLKPEYRAEALAHLAYTLTVFDRPEDALHVAETMLDRLTLALDQYEVAATSKHVGITIRVGASADLIAVTGEIMEAVRHVGALNRLRFRDNAELLAAWKSARNVRWREKQSAPSPAQPKPGLSAA